MPELIEPLVGTADFELLSQGAEAVRPTILLAYEHCICCHCKSLFLCSESGREVFWAK